MVDVGGTPVIQTGGYGCGDGMGGSWIWAFLLFALIGGNRGFGFGNGEFCGVATESSVYKAQQFQNLDNGVRSLENGLCSLGFNINSALKDGFYSNAAQLQQMNNNLNNSICTLGYQNLQNTNQIESRLASCCCSIERGLDNVNFNAERNANAIIQAGNANTRDILTWLQNKELADKNQVIFEMSQRAQTAEIIAAQKPVAPVPAYLQPNPYATYYGGYGAGCGYGAGYGYGCGSCN